MTSPLPGSDRRQPTKDAGWGGLRFNRKETPRGRLLRCAALLIVIDEALRMRGWSWDRLARQSDLRRFHYRRYFALVATDVDAARHHQRCARAAEARLEEVLR